MARKNSNKKTAYKQRNYSNQQQVEHITEADLYRKLFTTILSIFIVIGFVFVAFSFFGPSVGSFFGILSTNRNSSGSVDRIAPNSPIFSNIPRATKEKSITINGLAESGTNIKLFVNGPEVASTVADSEGLFTFTDVTLFEGPNTIFAKAIDDTGNESPKSETIRLVVDNDKPEIEILEPKDEAVVRNLNGRVQIKGELNEKATVFINDRKAIVKPDLTFELLLGVSEGEVEIKVVATDEAGNEETEEFKITYVRGS